MLEVRSGVPILRYRKHLSCFLTLADRLGATAEVCECESAKRPTLCVLRRRRQVQIDRDTRGIGVRAHPERVSPQMVRLREHDPPRAPVLIESSRREPQEQLLLRVVQQPEEVPIVAEVGDQRRRIRPRCRCGNDGASGRQVSLRKLDHRPILQYGEIVRRQCERSIGGCDRFRVSAQPQQCERQPTSSRDRSRIQRGGAIERDHRRIPLPETLLIERSCGEKVDIRRRTAQSFRVFGGGAAELALHGGVVIAEREVTLCALGSKSQCVFRRATRKICSLLRRRAVGVRGCIGARQTRPCQCKVGIDRRRLLVIARGSAQRHRVGDGQIH